MRAKKNHTFAAGKRVAVEARGTLALVATRKILADRVHTARGFVSDLRTLVGVPAFTGFRVPQVALLTDANALADELVFDARLGTRARGFRAASRGFLVLDTSLPERIPVRTAGTLARKRSRLVVAHGPRTARVTLALVNVRTSRVRISRVPGRAHALGIVVDQHAFEIRTALHVLAGI